MHHQRNPNEIVANLRHTFNQGTTKPLKHRLRQLKNLKRFLEDNEEILIQSMRLDSRKPREEARLEILIGINHIRYLLNNLSKWLVRKKCAKRLVDVFDGVYIYNDPYGVVLVMGSWNVPILTLLPIAGALAAGNCVVAKPSHQSPEFSTQLARILPQYLNSDHCQVFIGDVEATTQLLQEKFDYIYYTGSLKIGKIIHEAANKHLTPTTLELGGKNPVFIDDTADLKMTATRIMWGKCFNSGQTCIAPDYILCSKKVEVEFIKHAQIALESFYGKQQEDNCPIINDEHMKRLVGLMDGLTIAMGGKINPLENFIEPTIAVDVDPNHPIMQEEIFGPILPILTINSVEEAVRFINTKDKPLAIYIFSRCRKVQNFILNNTSCGGVTVNDTLMHLMVESLPFGGVGASGMGTYKAKNSFDTFTHKKGVLIKNFSPVIEQVQKLRYPPYSKKKTDLLAVLLKSRCGPNYGKWLSYFLTFVLGCIFALIIFAIYYYISI